MPANHSSSGETRELIQIRHKKTNKTKPSPIESELLSLHAPCNCLEASEM